MKLKDILSIGGKPGLYKFISQAKNGIIVEHLKDKKRFPAYSTAKVSALEDIAVFTETDEVKLSEIFDKIHEMEGGEKTISHKSSPDELKDYFAGILPDYDRDRVYVSDIKKIISWYNFLQEIDMLIPGEEEDEKSEDPGESAEENPESPEDKNNGQS